MPDEVNIRRLKGRGTTRRSPSSGQARDRLEVPVSILPVLVEHKTRTNIDGPESAELEIELTEEEAEALDAGTLDIAAAIEARYEDLEQELNDLIALAEVNRAAIGPPVEEDEIVVSGRGNSRRPVDAGPERI